MSTEANGSPIIFKKSASLRRRPGPQPALPSHDELFRQLYVARSRDVARNSNRRMFPNGKPYFSEGDGELRRSKALALRAWNVAAYSVPTFRDERFQRGAFAMNITTAVTTGPQKSERLWAAYVQALPVFLAEEKKRNGRRRKPSAIGPRRKRRGVPQPLHAWSLMAASKQSPNSTRR